MDAAQHTERKTWFLSHSSGDDTTVRELSDALADLGADITIDSRAFHGGDPLESTIRRAIGRAAGVLVLVTPKAHASSWVARELKHALVLQKERGGHESFPVVPLLLDGTPLGALEVLFDEPPIHVAVRSAALDAAPHDILVALRLREPTDAGTSAQPPAEPVEELVLELSEPTIHTHADGRRRARAKARLVHVPATPGRREVHGKPFTLEAPLGVIEADDLRWYLEQYAIWPSPLLGERAKRIEAQLQDWGRKLHDAALPPPAVAEVLKSRAALGEGPLARRFSIEVDATAAIDTPEDDIARQQEAATQLLGLPWELLHDGRSHLFQGAQAVRVRRRLPTEHAVPVPVLATPIRVLLLSPRPEDEACGYIDHRASAEPMVQAMEALAGQVSLTLLTPPTLGVLRDALQRAKDAGKPYHVLHFDGHGVYDRRAGLGALCFEHEDDAQRARGRRRHVNVPTPELGALLRDHGIPLVFLKACQTAQAESASESVAAALLKTGVGSVVAMSHSVLVETSRRFVQAFYRALSEGRRVGSAMLAGQRELKDNPVRGRLLGVGDFTLQDWFVPVLYQDRDDPQLFRETPANQTIEDWQLRLKHRLGALPAPPAHSFVGRSRELLALERLLAVHRHAVLRGQGGEGKTALAVEFARWRVRARQVERAAFVSVESHGHAGAVLDAIGRQLVGDHYSVAAHATLEVAAEPVKRALRERSTLLVIDNLESVLAAPGGTDDAMAADERDNAAQILDLTAELLACGAHTRILFTSREALPAPFDGQEQVIELERLSRDDAVQLVERSLGLYDAGRGREAEAQREDIESLVEAVHGHARTLALLAPTLRQRGAAATEADLVALMAEMERTFPGQRERSLLASVELSLRRLPQALREKARVLAVFQGAVDLGLLRAMTGWDQADVQALGAALVDTGLATAERYNHLSLNPALCPYLAAGWIEDEFEALVQRWTEAMGEYAAFLNQQQGKDIEMAATLTLLELPNLMALLDRVARAGDPEASIDLTTTLHELLQRLSRPRSMTRIAQLRDAAVSSLGKQGWSHAQFEAERTRIEQLSQAGRVADGLTGAQRLHRQASAAGVDAYRNADYDSAIACLVFGRMLRAAGRPTDALPLQDEARRRFEEVEAREPGCGAARMASAALAERADCLSSLGRLDDAAQTYEQVIALDEQHGAERDVAVSKVQLGTVRLLQRRFKEALAAWTEARKRFATLGEAASVASAWHQIGVIHQEAGDGEAAEHAYRHSLSIKVQLNDLGGQANTLIQLGNLYGGLLSRPEDAVIHYRQAAERSVALQDVGGEGRACSNLARTLGGLGRLTEARVEVEHAIECKQGLGHAAESWKAWTVLAEIEHRDGRIAEALQARTYARDAYLAYRRDGGENHSGSGRLAAKVTGLLAAGERAAAATLLRQLATEPNLPADVPHYIAALQTLVAGNRDPSLADLPELHYSAAAEIRLLLEILASSPG